MPGTTRYSATFDRPYEEDEQSLSNPPGMRRSRSQSWQANLGFDGRPYAPLENSRLSNRSSSTDSGSSKSVENIPTRTVSKPVVKSHNNPFQFVKVGSSPLYKKAEEQLKKAKEIKKVEVLKEEEEEWQSNLDSWKSRRRKMSEDVFRRQEEIRQFELEQQQLCHEANQKKIKTFSEMVESRAHRGRALSCCLISSPLELQKWEMENNNSKNNGVHSYSEGSEENSAVNSEDEGVGGKEIRQRSFMNKKSQSAENILSNSSSKSKFFELNGNALSPNNGSYFDSGLESISSSHRTGDTPDSCSDFSQDSGSCIDCDSPRASGLVINGVNLLEDRNHNDSDSHFPNKENDIEIESYQCVNGEKSDSKLFKNESSQKSVQISSGKELEKSPQSQERSVESENEVFVDDFDELNDDAKTSVLSCLSSKAINSNATDMEGLKDNFSEQSSNLQNDANAIKAEIVVEDTNKINMVTDSWNKNSDVDTSYSSTSSDTDNNYSEFTAPVRKSANSLQSLEEENTYVVKIKKLKIKKSRKRKEPKNETEETLLVQKSSLSFDDSLNIVFQSPPAKSTANNSVCENKLDMHLNEQLVLKDVPPVEQVAEEMERLILQQLEEEERAKEMPSKNQENILDSPEHNLLFRSRSVEPPKEKPPPPPCPENEVQKTTSLKRINSTKRIKNEICKRRSNFLGIENDKSDTCDEIARPPPPALEQILKAEMELDRESRKKLEHATTERLILEENEMKRREQEIIEIMEKEERQKQMIINCDDFSDVKSDCTEVCDIIKEGDRIEILKEERKRMEKERILSEEQRLRLIEEKQLREREELIRKQEADNSPFADFTAPSLSGVGNLINAAPLASLSSKTNLNVSDLEVNGNGENHSSKKVLNQVVNENSEKANIIKPAVPPKPLKKKEAIRKERERLRQEQEALVREREEHRRKLKEEEMQMKSQQNSHAPDASVSRIGPLPPLISPAFTPQLTSPISAQPSTRENLAVNRNVSAIQNGVSSNINCGVPTSHSNSKRSKPIPPPKKTVKSELRNHQKVSSVRKHPHDPMSESKYNQNHWLIQEAEMRRITELKERQRASQFPNSQTHLAEDVVCSVMSRAPIHSPNMPLNNSGQEQPWNYGHSNQSIKKYPPVLSSDKPLGAYPREPPAKPSRVIPFDHQEQMLSVSGKKRCSHCNEELGRGAAMIIESLQLYYHIHCFQCCVCQAQLGNGSCGTDVRVRNNKLHCHNCYSNDEAGLKFSQV